MFLITDKLEKSELKYNLINEEKQEAMKTAAEIEYIPKRHNVNRLIYITLIGIAFITAAWLTLTSTTNHDYFADRTQLNGTETGLLTKTFSAVNETEAILNKVKESVSIISEYNVQEALKYVNAIQEMLKERTRYAAQKINQIVTDKIREIENELTSFDYVIEEAGGGIVDYTLQGMKTLRESISSTTNATYRTDFENVLNGAQEKVASAFQDLDEMYTFYGSYMSDIIDKKVHNATDRISMIVNSNRRSCECTIKEKVNFCYTVSSQNVKISTQLESLVKVFGILNNTADILDTLEPVMLKDADRQSCSLIAEARNTLNEALVKSETLLESVLKDDDCFLGSAVRKVAYKNHQITKDFILNSFETSIRGLANSLNVTTSHFQVVREKHRKLIEQDLNGALNAIADQIRAKAKQLSPADALDDYVEKSSFSETRLWMDRKFQNVTEVINPLFEKRQNEIAEGLKYTLQFIVFQQVPFVSSLSVQNYLPTDVCPLSTDYQRFISITLDQHVLDPTAGDVKAQLTMSDDFVNEADTAQLVQDQSDDEVTNESANGQDAENNAVISEQSKSTQTLASAPLSSVQPILNENTKSEDPDFQIVITEIDEKK